MTVLPELFPGFASRRIKTQGAEIFLRTGGSGPPLLLLHGYPQTHACWHKMAPELAKHFTLVIPDLRGYGESSVPASDEKHLVYSKRAMAADCLTVMRELGHQSFMVLSHDRGARVGYRLALDHTTAVSRLITLDIVPTWSAWADMRRSTAMARFHWAFLAQPEPFSETMIGGNPMFFLEHMLAAWSAAKNLSAFAPEALAHYRASFSQPERVHASCEDYRAGATCDVEFDDADRAAGRKIACPTLALWGQQRENAFFTGPLEVWREWCTDVTGEGIVSGHFLPEEKPAETLARVIPFLQTPSPAR
jgi:haloacetate dehalogenase